MTHQMSKLKKFINKKTTTTKQGLNKFTFNYIQVKETVCFVTKNESRKKNQPVKKKIPSIVEKPTCVSTSLFQVPQKTSQYTKEMTQKKKNNKKN